jgi:hypothetical protein
MSSLKLTLLFFKDSEDCVLEFGMSHLADDLLKLGVVCDKKSFDRGPRVIHVHTRIVQGPVKLRDKTGFVTRQVEQNQAPYLIS